MRTGVVSGIVAATMALCARQRGAAAQETMYESQMVVVKPAPGRDRVAPMKPDWCGGYQPNRDCADPTQPTCTLPTARAQLDQEGGRGYSDKGLAMLARVACDKPNDPLFQKQVASWRQRWINLTGISEKDDRVAMKLRIADDRWQELEKAYCDALEPGEEASPEDKAIGKALQQGGGCGDNNALAIYKEGTDDELGWWLDARAQPASELARTVLVLRCLRIGVSEREWPDAKDPTVRIAYATCGPDARRLDRGRLDKELGDARFNEYARVHAREAFALARATADYLGDEYKKLATQDPAWKKLLFDAPEAGWTSWEKEYAANREAVDGALAFEKKFYGPSRKALAGCGASLRKSFDAFVAGKGPKSPIEAEKAAFSPVGYVLFEKLILCDAAEGRFQTARSEIDLVDQGLHRTWRGPRFASYYASLEALGEILADRTKFPVQASAYLLPFKVPDESVLGGAAKLLSNTTVKDDDAKATVAGVKRDGGEVVVSFKTVSWMEDTWLCKENNRIDHVNQNTGALVYQRDCVVTGKHKVSKTEKPLRVPAEVGGSRLQPGQTATFSVDQGDKPESPRNGFPKEVWQDKKLVVWYGVPL